MNNGFNLDGVTLIVMTPVIVAVILFTIVMIIRARRQNPRWDK